jgi:hypothetical protein
MQTVGNSRSSKIFWEDGDRIKLFLRAKKIIVLIQGRRV